LGQRTVVVDRDAAIARLLDLGDARADVSQCDETWVVLADPGEAT
jgi:hypothetical protein